MSKQVSNAESSPFQDVEKSLFKSRMMSWSKFGKRIKFYAPSFTHYENPFFHSSSVGFSSISITGTSCALNCKHCGGKVLETMISATTPDKLFQVCQNLKARGCTGCLISGGCLPDGTVPLGRFFPIFNRIKKELGLQLVVHTGIIGDKTAKQLAESGVDAALIDIIGSDDTIKEIYRLNFNVEAYEASLRALDNSGLPFIPHVIVGLHYGQLKGEKYALKMISRYKPRAIVILSIIPIKRTEMETISPPSPEDIVGILIEARLSHPETPIVLGCMRPAGKHRVMTDTLAVKAGVNAVAFPEMEAIKLANSMGLEIEFSQKCCSQIYEDLIF